MDDLEVHMTTAVIILMASIPILYMLYLHLEPPTDEF
jgi:hypothetical protein